MMRSHGSQLALLLFTLGCLSIPAPTLGESPRSYSDYYDRNLKNYYPYATPAPSAREPIYVPQYKPRDTISPYLNLTRPSGPYINNYYQYVRPDIQQRQNAAMGMAPAYYPRPESTTSVLPQLSPSASYLQPAVNPTRMSAPRTSAPSSYFETHYSNRREMGLPR